jgi:hypothetical protein
MEYKDTTTGECYNIAYSQELQKKDIELKKKILTTGRICIILCTIIMLLFATIIYTGVLTNAMKSLVCG